MTLASAPPSGRIEATQELIKDGDWIEVPSYDANGVVVDVNLNTIKIQNFDNTLTIIPTYKIVDVAYKNWRAMQDSGGRRMSPSIIIDISSIKFCDTAILKRLSKYELIADFINEKMQLIKNFKLEKVEDVDFPLDGPQITNIELFIKYSGLMIGLIGLLIPLLSFIIVPYIKRNSQKREGS